MGGKASAVQPFPTRTRRCFVRTGRLRKKLSDHVGKPSSIHTSLPRAVRSCGWITRICSSKHAPSARPVPRLRRFSNGSLQSITENEVPVLSTVQTPISDPIDRCQIFVVRPKDEKRVQSSTSRNQFSSLSETPAIAVTMPMTLDNELARLNALIAITGGVTIPYSRKLGPKTEEPEMLRQLEEATVLTDSFRTLQHYTRKSTSSVIVRQPTSSLPTIALPH